MLRRLVGLSLLLSIPLMVGGAAFVSCAEDGSGPATQCPPPVTTTAAPPPANEWVEFHVEVPLTASDFDPLASGLFGSAAQAGHFIEGKELSPGIAVTSSADPQTPQQTLLTFSFNDGTNPDRVVAVAPSSFAMGNLFISAVDVAMSTMQSEEKASAGSSETFFLEHRVTSAMGGKLSFGVRGVLGAFTLVVDVTSPHTGLTPSMIGKPVDTFSPYDTVAGTVWFGLTQAEFDFFVSHAYGEGATTKQNFDDFQLVPFNWLHLTVDPHLTQQFVDVSFDVITVDNQRVHVANAPASVLAGSTFQGLVDRNMTTMTAQETQKAGSSTPWTVPFYYNDPNGGGVVQVIAQGQAGNFTIAYAIESPQNALKDVPFVPYQPVKLVPPDASATASCADLGDPSIKLAASGTLDITFSASSVILSSTTTPLKGTIYCSVYQADQVNIGGPLPNAVTLQSFTVPNADLRAMPLPTFTTKAFFDGDYQVLCFQDLAGSGNVATGDPVTLPIGGYTIACNKNPIDVEFAILDPQ
jgi:hypothetical protein